MSFEEYLASKKIDSGAYKMAEPTQWFEFSSIFDQMHSKSFTMQKLNLINGIRREYPYVEEVVELVHTKPKTPRPVMKPNVSAGKPKMGKPVMKPKIGKAVMKPKIKTDPSEEKEEVAKPKPVMKPKMVRPVMKPKKPTD